MSKIPLATSEASLSSATSSSSSSSSSESDANDHQQQQHTMSHLHDHQHQHNQHQHQTEDINDLTNYVKTFREALSKMKMVFSPNRDLSETRRVAAHERLGEVLKVMREVLEKYSKIQSPDLLVAAGQLIQQVKQYNYDDPRSDPRGYLEAIDQLAMAFSTRVSEFLMGDFECRCLNEQSASAGKSSDDFTDDGIVMVVDTTQTTANNSTTTTTTNNNLLTPDQIDDKFLALPDGIDLALHRAKVWSKYAKDVIAYVEKRVQLEAEHHRNLVKHAQQARQALQSHDQRASMPFQNIFTAAIDQDIDNGNSAMTTCAILLGHKFVEPLTARRNEHEKIRKQIKDVWSRELKRMHESVANLKKARSLYINRQTDLDKARTTANDWSPEKMEKKRRTEEDAQSRAQEAEDHYKASVREANDRAANLHRVKKDLLKQIRELLIACEMTMKTVTCSYLQLCHVNAAPVPVQFQNLAEEARKYQPGSSLISFVKELPVSGDLDTVRSSKPFVFERHKLDRSTSGGGGHLTVDIESSESEDSSSPGVGVLAKLVAKSSCPSSGDELECDPDLNGGHSSWPFKTHVEMSKAAESHSFRKLKTPSRCRECDSYVYFHGIECVECGLAAHKKCLGALAIQCGHVKLPGKMNTFGVPLTSVGDGVPKIVKMCVKEIDERGYNIKGIYRVSGVKSRVEKLCQSFESGHSLVDLSQVPANVIANVLKLYLRQLPEPLLTYRLYSEFVYIAKSYPTTPHPLTVDDQRQLIVKLKQTVGRLPDVHRLTLAYLMKHLKRLTSWSHENNMPASNLGIVFGPTLLRTSHGGSSLSSLVDTGHQTRIIELLIQYADQVFGNDENQENTRINNNNHKNNNNNEDSKSDDTPLIENPPVQAKIFKSSTSVMLSIPSKKKPPPPPASAPASPPVNQPTAATKQLLVEARRQFFNIPPPNTQPNDFRSSEYRPLEFRTVQHQQIPSTSSDISLLSKSITTSVAMQPKEVQPKLRRTISSQPNQVSNRQDGHPMPAPRKAYI